ncbi:MAG: histidine phosphatase family protein [Nocardioidaceae bacterium]
MSDLRRLVVLRHAKAEPFGETDHARRLTERGQAAAADVGRHLRARAVRPDLVLVSSAVRTRETWTAAASAGRLAECPARYEDALFSGSFDRVLELLREAPAAAGTVLLVGHNPTAELLCHFLDDGEGDPEATTGLLGGFPPGALALLEVTVPWAGLAPETGRVAGYYVGRG